MTRSATKTRDDKAAKDAADTEPAITENPEDVVVTATIVSGAPEGGIPDGTPVLADGGRVGKVISHDPITGQVQIVFEDRGRGWFNPEGVAPHEPAEDAG